MKQRKRKFLTRVTAFVLAMVLICPTMSVLAADVSESGVTEEGKDSEIQTIPNNTEITEEEKTKIENVSETFVDEGEVQENLVSKETEDEIEQQMNWTYVESSYLATPGIQRIVVSWGEDAESVDDMTLKVQGSNGIQEEWAISNAVNNLYLFEKEFTDESQSGTYEATELTVKVGTSEKTFTMDEMGAEVLFGVNEEYAGVEELRPIEDEMNTDNVSASVAIINEDGTLEAEESIGDALAQAMADVQASMPSTMSIQDESTDTRAGNIVVALDPGHDANDRGAAGNGLREEDLTLKIANYCKEELEGYNGVTVYMTRTGAACPYNKPGISCMADRVNAAYKAGAKIFVSFHLNSFNGKAYGAEVIVPNKNWKPNVGIEGTELGNAVLDELVKLGLTKRKVYSKDSTVNEYYPDGSKSDYFSVQIHCKEKGIPGIIVEHAFIDNANDANKYLKTEAGLKSLGVADATGIAKYLGLTKGKWVEDKNGWKYQLSNGVFAKKQLLTIDGKTYYFDANGYRVTGWQDISGKRYYFMPDGHMHTGWLSFGSTYYYMMPDGHMHTGWLSFGSTYYYLNEKGVRQTDWQTIDGNKYYFNKDGVRQIGWQDISGKRYYFMLDGHMHTGWLSFGSTYYYMMPDGHMHTGWLSFGSTYYYLNEKGVRQTGWKDINGKRYYFMPDGHRHTGWLSFGSTRYYLNQSGEMQTGKVLIDGTEYFFNTDGKLQELTGAGWKTINGKKYYYNVAGERVTGWQDIDGKRYYFMPDGHMHTGWVSFGSTYYYMMPDGHMHTGWLSFGSTYYYLNEKGVRQTGWQTIDGKRYYFMPDGHRHTGWLSFGSTRYYMNQLGQMQTGKVLIDGKEYFFNADGKLQGSTGAGWQTINGKKYYYNAAGEKVIGWQDIDGKRYYFMPDGHMHTGWLSFGSTYYYMMPDGHMHTGWLSFGSTYYYLNEKGVRQTGWQTIDGKRYYFMPDGHMHTGWLSFGSTYYYMMPDGHMHTGWLSFGSTYYYLNEKGVRQTGWQTIDGKEYYFDENGVRMTGYEITGKTSVSASQMVQLFKKQGKTYPTKALSKGGATTIEDFVNIVYQEANAEGIKAEVVFCQSMVETGWLQFKGDVKAEQFNFAGLGAVGNGAGGADFSSYGINGVRMGIRAQVQHLKCYANKDALVNPCVDPRWGEWLRGKAPYVEWLAKEKNPNNIGWATDADYGKKIIALIKQL